VVAIVTAQRESSRSVLTTRAKWTVAVLAAVVLVCFAVGAALSFGGLYRAGSVEDLVGTEAGLHPIEATHELCGDPSCVEGWRTDVGTYVRFDSEGEAEYWSTVLGDDGRRWKTIVLDMRGKDLSFDERRRAIDILFSSVDWS
jgi:hypothetical protein